MRVERTKKISGVVRFWAATCLIVWVLGFSVAVIARVCSCCDSTQKSCGSCGDKSIVCGVSSSHSGECAGVHSSAAGCCGKSQGHNACESEAGCSTTALELKPALPLALPDGLFLSLPTPLNTTQSVPFSTSAAPILSSSTHSIEQVIPPELRLGPALW